jgi:hypothetical protein
MGYRVQVIGHIDVKPRLNDHEFEYLTAFAESRRWSRPQGPLWAPSTPFGLDEEAVGASTHDINTPPGGQPGLWCPWVPSCAGACLVVREDGTDGKNYGVTPWLQYVIDTFLRPGASAHGEPGFEDFSFDHDLSGAVAAHRSDTGELWLVRVRGHVVQHESVRKGDPWWSEDDVLESAG